jgi:hypothetical protein
MQKFFFGDIVIPLMCGSILTLSDIVSPTNKYDICFQAPGTSLLMILYEKQPPFLFLSSSHIGLIPLRIKNNMQFIINFGGSISVIVTACSSVLNS